MTLFGSCNVIARQCVHHFDFKPKLLIINVVKTILTNILGNLFVLLIATCQLSDSIATQSNNTFVDSHHLHILAFFFNFYILVAFYFLFLQLLLQQHRKHDFNHKNEMLLVCMSDNIPIIIQAICNYSIAINCNTT